MNRPGLRGVGLCLLALMGWGAVVAAAEPDVAEAQAGSARAVGTAIEWDLGDAVSATVTLSHPDGTVTRHEFAPGERPRIEALGGAEALEDGQYVYEITGTPGLRATAMNQAGFVRSGTFEIRQGVADLHQESPLAIEGERGGACFGDRCDNANAFWQAWLNIAGANPWLTYSRGPNLPVRWDLGLRTDLDIFELTRVGSVGTGPSRRIVAFFGGAPANSLVVKGDGRIGLGTATPFKTLHINTAETPGIRLEGNASAGRTAHVWDIGASSVAFTVGDDGHFPFQVRATAPTSSLTIAASGFVGFGTDVPAAKLHIVGSGNTRALFDDRGDPASWSVGTSGSDFVLDETSHSGVEFYFGRNGTLTLPETITTGRDLSVGRDGYIGQNLQVVGNLTVGGQILNPSSRALKGEFAAVDAQAILERVVAMPVSSWSYNDAAGVRHIGPMAEDFHASFGLGSTDKAIATVDSDGVALAAIQGLHQKLEDENAELRRRIEILEAVVRRLAPELP